MKTFITFSLLITCTLCLVFFNNVQAQTYPDEQFVEIKKTIVNNNGLSETQVVKIYKSDDGDISRVTLNGALVTKNTEKYNALVAHYRKTQGRIKSFQLSQELSEKTDNQGLIRQQIKTTYGITSYDQNLMNPEEGGLLLTDKMRREMVKDGLIPDSDISLEVTLTDKSLAINGISQKETLASKYRGIYEHHTGRTILEGSNIELLLVTK